MHIGVQMPQGELGADPGEVREFSQGIQDLGFHHVSVLEQVVGLDPTIHVDKDLSFNSSTLIHEPMVLFGFIAACAPALHLMTAVLVLPRRQTALVAKQMAEVDILAGGRTRLGVGIGANDVEYEALGMDFRARRRRLEEQVVLLRRLWTEPVISFEGDFDRLRAVGINPLPVQRPIPIWFGGRVEAARRRAVELGDGLVMDWPLPESPIDSEWPALLEEMRVWRRDCGRDGDPGFEARLAADLARTPEEWRSTAEQWGELGVSHLAVRTLGLGLKTVDDHLQRLALVRDALGDLMR